MNFLGCRAIAAVAMLCISLPALAQIPASQLPGVERQRFEELPPPRAQPGGAVIKLPSTVAPEGADDIALVVRDVTIVGYRLLAGDLPGLKFKNSLKASTSEPGAATLVIEVEHKLFDANARIDNRGSKARGPLEYFTGVTLNNPFGLHDAFTLNYASA